MPTSNWPQSGRQGRDRPERAINVEPQILSLGKIRQPGKIVDRANIHRPGGPREKKRPQPLRTVLFDVTRKLVQPHAPMFVAWDHSQRLASEAGDLHRPRQATMRRSGRIADQPGPVGADLTHRRPQAGGARDQYADQVCNRGAGHQHTRCIKRKAQHLGRPGDDLTLDLDRGVITAAQVRVQSGGEKFSQHAHRVAAAMHPAHEFRVQVAGRIRQDQAAEILIDIFRRGGIARQLPAQLAAHFVGHRTPDRTLTQRLKVVEHVVEHAVTKRAQAGPVGGIEATHATSDGWPRGDQPSKPCRQSESRQNVAVERRVRRRRSLHRQAHDVVVTPKRPADVMRLQAFAHRLKPRQSSRRV